jgi:hypothetical protein
LLFLGASVWATAEDTPQMQMTTGNGEKNWIMTNGVVRQGSTFTFGQVEIDGNGWLVIHQIVDGKPVGEKYLGATYLESGKVKDVAVTVDYEPKEGEAFVVMLHRDVNENKTFDFVFVDGGPHVVDKAVFEGDKMIALTFAAP